MFLLNSMKASTWLPHCVLYSKEWTGNQVRRYTPLTKTLRKLRQEEKDFQACVGFKTSHHLKEQELTWPAISTWKLNKSEKESDKKEIGRKRGREDKREEGEREAMTLRVLTFQTILCISLLKDFRNVLCGCSFVLYSALVSLSSRP